MKKHTATVRRIVITAVMALAIPVAGTAGTASAAPKAPQGTLAWPAPCPNPYACPIA